MCKHFLIFEDKINLIFLDFLWFFTIIYYENIINSKYNFHSEK